MVVDEICNNIVPCKILFWDKVLIFSMLLILLEKKSVRIIINNAVEIDNVLFINLLFLHLLIYLYNDFY